ncbi:hypothetical protein V6N11_001357 [Hibiscus sabdariffa]|uniref:Uncharacterized protein n=1 Tax=Hibiscus sabdariffa TaxID=183260 RepID=A0ABR2S037_9ROSI
MSHPFNHLLLHPSGAFTEEAAEGSGILPAATTESDHQERLHEHASQVADSSDHMVGPAHPIHEPTLTSIQDCIDLLMECGQALQLIP